MTVEEFFARTIPRREIRGISAMFLPFTEAGALDHEAFQLLLSGTCEAGLEPAINMDTGFGPQLSPKQRYEILDVASEVLGGRSFVAGAMPFGSDGDPMIAYRKEITGILELGGIPIIFPSDALSPDPVAFYRAVLADCPVALGFELGPMFAYFGRVFDTATFRGLLELPALVGLKHSSLSRRLELERLAECEQRRPGFRIYTGNDLAIDMVYYGSDYLLGLSAFDPAAFALRDAWWLAGDTRCFELNDALQAVGTVAFRDPVPAYKDSCATYLRLTGVLDDPFPHPDCPRRPPWEAEILAPMARRVEEAKRA